MSEIPGAGPVREEDAFDVAAVTAWLRENTSESASLGEAGEVLQFGGGKSNLTYLLRYPGRDLILRRPPRGTKAKGAHDMRREHDLQKALAAGYDKVATMVGYCGDEQVIGSEFYVMERLVGTILRGDIPDGLLDTAGVERLCRNAINALSELHEVDVEAVGLGELSRGPGYVSRQVGGWTKRYANAITPDVGDFAKVTAWLAEHQPQDTGQVLIHNDFRFDNLVLAPQDPTRIIGLLDWELATVGDPWMDLGSAMAYWVQPDDDETFLLSRLQPTHTPGMLTRREAVHAYASASGRSMDDETWRFYEVFGLFRLAVILQQIYYRYYHGQTTNPMFSAFGPMCTYLQGRCERLLGL